MRTELRKAGIDAGDYVEADLLWDEGGPIFVFERLPEDDVEDARDPRRVSECGCALTVEPPNDLLEADPEFGLGLDIDSYDNDNALRFEPMVEVGVVGLVPIDHVDGLNEWSIG